jgi:hypothetical protein
MIVTDERPRTRAPRADAGTVRATERDALAMSWVVEMYGMPVDLVGRLTGASEAAVRQLLWRWRRAGWVETAKLTGGPQWVWATALGVELFGRRPYAVGRPSAQRLAHMRAVIETRLWVEHKYELRNPEWRSERELRWELGTRVGSSAARAHMPDAEIEWDTTKEGLRSRLAVEVEVTPKGVERTVAILRELFHDDKRPGGAYRQVVYVVSGRARPVVERAIGELGPDWRERVSLRSLEDDVIRENEQEVRQG